MNTPEQRTKELGEQAQAEFARQAVDKTKRLDVLAERIAASMWGYFEGGSAGSAEAVRYFEHHKRGGGPRHVIERVREQLRAEFKL